MTSARFTRPLHASLRSCRNSYPSLTSPRSSAVSKLWYRSKSCRHGSSSLSVCTGSHSNSRIWSPSSGYVKVQGQASCCLCCNEESTDCEMFEKRKCRFLSSVKLFEPNSETGETLDGALSSHEMSLWLTKGNDP